LHDSTLTDDNRRRFQGTAERWKQKVDFIDVSERLFEVFPDPDKEGRRFSRGALFRLLIPDLLNVSKVVYLDCDVVVNMDIRELWEISIENFFLAAVRSLQTNVTRKFTFREKVRTWIIGCRPDLQFCSGVLLLNLRRIRENYDFPQEAVRYFERYGHVSDCADEDFLFALFHKETLLIDTRFDCFSGSGKADDRIVHFIGDSKPWKTPQKIPEHFLYWKVFMESEWSDQIGDVLTEIFRDKPLELYHSADCAKLLLRRIPRHLRLDRCYDFYKQLMIIAKELYFRRKSRIES
jgi:lipopolysaccharide biosynthesis glycosyltransferase